MDTEQQQLDHQSDAPQLTQKSEQWESLPSTKTLEDIFPDVEKVALMREIISSLHGSSNVEQKLLQHLSENPREMARLKALSSPDMILERLRSYIDNCTGSEALPTFKPIATDTANTTTNTNRERRLEAGNSDKELQTHARASIDTANTTMNTNRERNLETGNTDKELQARAHASIDTANTTMNTNRERNLEAGNTDKELQARVHDNIVNQRYWNTQEHNTIHKEGNIVTEENNIVTEDIQETHLRFKDAYEKEIEPEEHQELIPKPEELQQAKQTLQNSDRRTNLKSAGISEEVVNDYLAWFLYQERAQQHGVQVSAEFSSSFKAFQKSLNLPDRLLAQIKIQADIPTTNVSSFANNPQAQLLLFDPETGSKSLKSSYERSREQYSETYDHINIPLEREEVIKQYGTKVEQEMFKEITELTIKYQNKELSEAEQRDLEGKLNERNEKIRPQLLQKKAEYEEVVKLAMGRTLISGQAIQHCKRLNSYFWGGFVFNPAKAFEMQDQTLTTTVKSAEGHSPFRIRTDASQPNTIQVSQFLGVTALGPMGEATENTHVSLGKEDNFINIHYTAPSEKQLLNEMLAVYSQREGLSQQEKGNLTLGQRYEKVQADLQKAVEKCYVNEEFVQSAIQGQMESNILAQQRIEDRKSIFIDPNTSPFNRPSIEWMTTSDELMACLTRVAQKLPKMNSQERADFQACSSLLKEIGTRTMKNGKLPAQITELGQYFFQHEHSPLEKENENLHAGQQLSSSKIAALRTLALGETEQQESWQQFPLLHELKSFLTIVLTHDGRESKDTTGFSHLAGRFLVECGDTISSEEGRRADAKLEKDLEGIP